MKTPPTYSQPTVLRIDQLRFSHAKAAQPSALSPLFQNLSAQISSGLTWVQGGEERGKTTLLRLLAGELSAQAGTLSINGVNFQDQPTAYQAQVFWVAPRSEAFDPLIVADYFSSVQRRYPRFDALLLAELVEGLSLAEHLNKALYMLSAGSKRKVWLAAAFASGAAVTLLDEPFAALDMASIRFVTELLADAAEHSRRAWVIADYEAPQGLSLANVIDLGS